MSLSDSVAGLETGLRLAIDSAQEGLQLHLLGALRFFFTTFFPSLTLTPVESAASEFLFGTSRFEICIARSCCGYFGAALFSGSLFLACVARRGVTLVEAVLAWFVGILCIHLINLFRLIALVLLGHYDLGPGWALDYWHPYAGVVLYPIGTFLIIYVFFSIQDRLASFPNRSLLPSFLFLSRRATR